MSNEELAARVRWHARLYDEMRDMFVADAAKYEASGSGDTVAKAYAVGWAKGMSQAYGQVGDDLRKFLDS